MRLFQGSGGEVHLASDPFRFTRLRLEDCGNGFDWRSADPALRYWVDVDELRIESYRDGTWEPVAHDEVRAATGRVSLARSMHGRYVYASGVCLPLVLAATGHAWRLSIGYATVREDALGGQNRYASVPTKTLAAIEGLMDASDQRIETGASVVVTLPQTGGGFFTGRGETTRAGQSVQVEIDQEGVTYAVR